MEYRPRAEIFKVPSCLDPPNILFLIEMVKFLNKPPFVTKTEKLAGR